MNYKTRPDFWTVANLRAFAEEKQIKIPSFQRRLRWSDEKKRGLLDSIDQGLPIGTLLVHESAGKPYLLVDGLQRVTTIIEAAQKPYSYLSAETIAQPGFALFAREAGIDTPLGDQSQLLKIVDEWLKMTRPESVISTNQLQQNLRIQYPKIKETIVAQYVSEIVECAATLVTRREQYPIPLIKYTGPISDLPEIFERLNQLGTKLTKYEIYMATWENEGLITPGDSSAADNVLDRFSAAEDYGIQVDNHHPGKLTLGEYLLTLGHKICEGRPRLFGTNYEETADSIGFQAACLSVSLPLAEMEGLHKKMEGLFDHNPDGQKGKEYNEHATRGFTTAISRAADFWEEVLGATRLEKSNHSVPHGSLISTAMVVAALIEALGDQPPVPGIWVSSNHWPRSRDANRVHTIALRRYLIALLSPEYSRQYGKIQDLVWADSGSQKIPSRWFFTEPSRELLTVFDNWWLGQLQKGMGRNVPSVQKTLLAVVTKTLQPEKGIPWGQQEVDHVISWDRISGMGWHKSYPVSAVANLCVLDRQTNGALKSSGSLTSLLSHPDVKGGSEEHAKRRAMIDSNIFLSNSELKKKMLSLDEIIHSDSTDSESAFLEFLNVRWAAVKGHLIGA